jgi:hypothetical protein
MRHLRCIKPRRKNLAIAQHLNLPGLEVANDLPARDISGIATDERRLNAALPQQKRHAFCVLHCRSEVDDQAGRVRADSDQFLQHNQASIRSVRSEF